MSRLTVIAIRCISESATRLVRLSSPLRISKTPGAVYFSKEGDLVRIEEFILAPVELLRYGEINVWNGTVYRSESLTQVYNLKLRELIYSSLKQRASNINSKILRRDFAGLSGEDFRRNTTQS